MTSIQVSNIINSWHSSLGTKAKEWIRYYQHSNHLSDQEVLEWAQKMLNSGEWMYEQYAVLPNFDLEVQFAHFANFLN